MTGPTCCALGVLVAALAAAPARAEEMTQPAAPASAAAPEAVRAEAIRAVEPAPDLPFDPTGRRDPFRPLRAGFATRTGDPPTPLQRYDIGQLRLVAIIYNTRDPRAVVEDDEGLGYIVKVGTPIGPNGGQVQVIEQGRLVIQEGSVDFYGETHPTSVVMELRTAETDRGKR